MDDKNKVVKVTTTQKKVVVRPKVEEIVTNDGKEHSIEEHMAQNEKNSKVVIDWKNLAMLLILILIVVGAVFLILKYLDKQEKDNEIRRVATSTTYATTTTTTTTTVVYETTTRVQTQATHTVYQKR